MPRVSIVIATFNRAHLVVQAIESALAQTYPDFEIIIVDDGSTDTTREVVAQIDDPRLRYVYQTNAGLAAARNTGITHAQGEYVTFLDDDDLFLPHKLAVQVAVMDQSPEIGWTSGGYRLTDMQGGLIGEQRPWLAHPELNIRLWLFECPTVVHAVLIRRAWLERIGGFDAGQRQSDDWDTWLRLAYAGCQMVWVPELVCDYRFHNTNMIGETRSKKRDSLRFLDNFFSQPNLPPQLKTLQGPAYAQMYLRAAAANYGAMRVEEATQDVVQALKLNPGLAADKGKLALDMLLGYARSPLIKDPLGYTRIVLANLPEQPFTIADRRARLLGQVAAGLFFSASESRNWAAVPAMFVKMVGYDPGWLRNRGVWSILTFSLLKLSHSILK